MGGRGRGGGGRGGRGRGGFILHIRDVSVCRAADADILFFFQEVSVVASAAAAVAAAAVVVVGVEEEADTRQASPGRPLWCIKVLSRITR